MESIQRKTRGNADIELILISRKRDKGDCRCRECSFPSCHDPIWNDSYCQFHYNEEHYLSR